MPLYAPNLQATHHLSLRDIICPFGNKVKAILRDTFYLVSILFYVQARMVVLDHLFVCYIFTLQHSDHIDNVLNQPSVSIE